MELQISQDMRFQRREWKLQRVGTLLLGLVLVATVLGLFGDGPLSKARRESGRFAVEYERFGRFGSPVVLQLNVKGDRLWLGEAFLRNVQVNSVVPEPTAWRDTGNRHELEFAVPSGASELEVALHVSFREYGKLVGEAGAGEDSVAWEQWIYP